ncbi:MAG: cobalamin biosynthesis protein CobD, partial [Alphaproteobacteria bacterium]|nr:cobalamin biosynthesis protein CobD [Alphaproteobacteria bacterium]
MNLGSPSWIADPAVVLLLALVIDALAGEMRLLFRFVTHPVVAIGKLVASLDKRLNRENRSERARRFRGLLAVLVVVAVVGAIAWFTHIVVARLRSGWLVEAFFVAILVAQRSLYDHVATVRAALAKDGLVAGRRAVAHIVGRDPDSLDEHGVARAAVESLFENFADGVVAPIFWYVLLGLPGIAVCKAINTLDSMIGHKTPRHGAFGEVAARLDTAVNYLPARLSALLIAIAAAVIPGGNPFKALQVMVRDARKHNSFNAGWPEGAAAGALGFALAGPRRYHGQVVDAPWIGDGRARLTAEDITRALRLYVVACLVHGVVMVGWLLLR